MSRGTFESGQLGPVRDEAGESKGVPTSGLGGWNDTSNPLVGPSEGPFEWEDVVSHTREFMERLFPIKGSWDEYDYFEDPPVPGHLVLWTKDDKRSQWLSWTEVREGAYWHWQYDEDPSELAVSLAQSTDVYFGIGIQGAKLDGRGTAKNVVAIPGMWADIDVRSAAHPREDLPPTKEDGLMLIREMPLRPNIIVDTGYGLQAYWLFNGLWHLTSESERESAANLSRRFTQTLQQLAACHGWHVDNTSDLARLLRVPGTLNHKGDVPVMARVVYLYNRTRRNPEELMDLLPEPHVDVMRGRPEPNLRPTDEEVRHVTDEAAYINAVWKGELDRVSQSQPGERNNALFRASATLGQFVASGYLNGDETYSVLERAALGVGLTAEEAEATIASGLARGASRPRRLVSKDSLGRAQAHIDGSSGPELDPLVREENPEDEPAGAIVTAVEDSPGRPATESSGKATSVRLLRPSEVGAELAELPPEIVEGLLPVGLTTFIGKPGEGKSTLLRQLVLDVVTGRPFLERPTVRTRVAYLSLEDPVGRLLESLAATAHGADLPEELLMLGSDTAFSLKELPQFMASYDRVGLWVIDPLPAAWDPEGSFGYQQEYAVGHRIKLLADKHRAAVIVTGHAGKRWDVNAVTAGTGTVGLPGSADNRWLISRKAGSRANLHVQGGRRLPGGPAISLAFDGLRFRPTGGGSSDAAGPSAHISEQRKAILEALRAAGKPTTPKELAKSLQMTSPKERDAVKSLLRKMKNDGQVTPRGDGRYSPA